MSNVRSLQDLIRVTRRINTTASCRLSRVLPHALFQLTPPEVTAAQSVEVLSVNTSTLLVGFAQQGPVQGAFAHISGSSSSQFMKGASRRRAAPGGRSVEVAARAATCPPATRWSSQEKDRGGQHRARPAFICRLLGAPRNPRFRRPVVWPGPARARRLRPWRATAGVGEIRPRLLRFGYAMACEQTPPAGSFRQESAVRKRELMNFATKRPNPSIKRTVKGLRPSPAAYVKR